jgi:hypothetical protein
VLLIPARFLFRFAHPCRYRKAMPTPAADRLIDLGAPYRVENFAAIDEKKNFAEVCLAWNELGLGVQVEVRGKEQAVVGDLARPRSSDGLSLWIDTRDARSSHRASRYCQQFHFLATGGGEDREEPAYVQTKIGRALEDAPFAGPGEVLVRRSLLRGGYVLEAFLSASALHGFDPPQHPRLGFFYSVRDEEHGEQLLSVGSEFPFWEDPSLWSVLELT